MPPQHALLCNTAFHFVPASHCPPSCRNTTIVANPSWQGYGVATVMWPPDVGPKAGGANGNTPVTSAAHHYGRGSPRAAAMRRTIPDDEISSGTDTDEDGALIEKARQAAEQKRAPPKKRGPTSMFHPSFNRRFSLLLILMIQYGVKLLHTCSRS